MDTYTLLYFNMDTQQGPTVWPWNSPQWYVVAWTAGGEFGGKNGYRYMYVWVPLLFSWNHCNIIYQLYPKIKCFSKKTKQNKTLLSSLNSSSFNRPPQQHGTLFCTDAKITPAGNSGLVHPGANEPQNKIWATAALPGRQREVVLRLTCWLCSSDPQIQQGFVLPPWVQLQWEVSGSYFGN